MSQNGQRWARFWLIAGVGASIAGNVANACLTDVPAPLLLRIFQAIIWPSFLFGGVEVLVRNRHVSGALARIGQAGLLLVAVPTVITSYVNLHALMIKSGEPGVAQVTGPLAVDGLMLGCTIMLLAVRHSQLLPAPIDIPAEDVDEALARLDAALRDGAADQDWDLAAEIELGQQMSEAPVSPAPAASPPATRSPRSTFDPAQVAVLALDGVKAAQACAQAGIGASTYGRWLRVARILKEDPRAGIDARAEKLSEEHVSLLRSLAAR